MKSALTASLVQCDAVLGDLGRNLETHLEQVATARDQGADLAIFPELSLTGYTLRDLTSEIALRADDERLAPLYDASRGIDVVAGWIERSDDNRLFNAAGYFSEGRLLHLHRKVYPVNYGMFEERRYWAPGDRVAAFDTRHGRIGLLICEDLWHPSTSYLLFADRADIVITISASPARGVAPDAADSCLARSSDAWDLLLRHQSLSFSVHSIFVNRCGVEDGISFAGGSLVVDPFGEVGKRLGMEPEQAPVVLEPGPLRRRRTQVPLLRDERLDVTLGNLQRIVNDRFVD
jgi:predicted amidohydrolase